jgi:hypothetical protein
MAWYELAPSGVYQVCFRFGGKRFSRSLKTVKEAEAKSALGRLEENIRLAEMGRLEIPLGVDLASFLLSDGKVSGSISVNTLTLKELFTRYFSALPHGSLEESTIYTMGIHRNSLERHFGRRLVESINHLALQEYVKAREVLPITIRKELATLKTVWNFGLESGLINAPYPRTKLKFPKSEQRPPFQSFQELQRTTGGKPSELWECCYLTKVDLKELLRHVKWVARHPFVYPLFLTAAYTGARRSELSAHFIDSRSQWFSISVAPASDFPPIITIT